MGRADVAFHVDVGFSGRRLRPALRDRGEFRRTTRTVLGPDRGNARHIPPPHSPRRQAPAGPEWPLYDAVTAPDSRYPIAPYLERRTLQPSVFHHGNRGLERDRILREG